MATLFLSFFSMWGNKANYRDQNQRSRSHTFYTKGLLQSMMELSNVQHLVRFLYSLLGIVLIFGCAMCLIEIGDTVVGSTFVQCLLFSNVHSINTNSNFPLSFINGCDWM